MAILTDHQKREIVEALAGFQSPASIVSHFRLAYGLDLTHKQVGRYDPTRPYYEGGGRWREIFEAQRMACLAQVSSIPVAHKAYRLNMLQEGVDAARAAKDWLLMAKLLKQAAYEAGGVTNEQNIHAGDAYEKHARKMTLKERHAAVAELVGRATTEIQEQLASCAEKTQVSILRFSVSGPTKIPDAA